MEKALDHRAKATTAAFAAQAALCKSKAGKFAPKWAALILATVAMASAGGMLALLITGTHFSVSSGVGFLALFGVSVQTGVIMLEYINELRARGGTIEDSAIDGAVLRLRPVKRTE